MAIPSSRKRSNEECKSVRETDCEAPSGLSRILEIYLMGQSNYKIVNGSHHFSGIANGHASGVLLEGHISSVMQSCFNAQMLTTKTKQELWCEFFYRTN
jgi:hypothetical protein